MEFMSRQQVVNHQSSIIYQNHTQRETTRSWFQNKQIANISKIKFKKEKQLFRVFLELYRLDENLKCMKI